MIVLLFGQRLVRYAAALPAAFVVSRDPSAFSLFGARLGLV
jgi:hypothetical protein